MYMRYQHRAMTCNMKQGWTVLSKLRRMLLLLLVPLTAMTWLVAGCADKDMLLEPDCQICYTYSVLYQESQPLHELRDVFFVDSSNGWAAGNGGILIHSTDGGANWSAQDSGQANTLYSVCFSGIDSGWAVGSSGTLVQTIDTGNSWSARQITDRHLTGVFFCDDLRGWAVGDTIILRTTNGGETWQAYVSPDVTIPYLRAVSFAGPTQGWAVGHEGKILHTDDGGSSWLPQSSGQGNPLLDIVFVDPSNGWAVGVGGVIIHTTNGGQSWSQQYVGTAAVLHGVAFWDISNGIAVGDSGLVFTTLNGGGHWERQASGTTNTLRDVAYLDPHRFCLAGDFGTIRITRTEEECCEE